MLQTKKRLTKRVGLEEGDANQKMPGVLDVDRYIYFKLSQAQLCLT